jgi:hypothetical protein
MAQNSFAVTESIVHGPYVNNKKYAYRVGMGMVPSAEFDVFFDDFHSFIVATSITNGPVANTPWGWAGAQIDSGATVTATSTAALGATGALTIADATASEGAVVWGTKSLQLTSGKKFFMEIRVRTGDVTDNAVQFGLSALTATTNPEDVWTTVADDVAAFGILDGSDYPQLLADTGNTGTAVVTQTVRPMVADTWHVLGLAYTGSALVGYVDGEEVVRTTTTVPTGIALAPFFGHLNGNGAGAAVVVVDYVRWCVER